MNKLKEIIKKNYKWIIFFILLIIFGIIAINVSKKEIFGFDSIIYNFLVKHRSTALNAFFMWITKLGGVRILSILTILCIIFIKDKKYKILVPINVLLITKINMILKNIFERPRPNSLRLIEEKGYSFPSGHAMASTAFYGLLIYIAYKKIENKKLRNTICAMLTILILIINTSRIYVGVHYVSDVIAGTCFSVAYLIVIAEIVSMCEKVKSKEKIS